MAAGKKLKTREKALIRRYLVWCYKTTKENLDRIDRKFTQSTVDRYILGRLDGIKAAARGDYDKFVDDFRVYIDNKEKEGFQQKFMDGKKNSLNSQYLYLYNRLTAIEAATRHFLGPRELAQTDFLYEQEMTRRILEPKEH